MKKKPNLSSEQKLSKNFNSSVFNKMYDENRIENIYDDGLVLPFIDDGYNNQNAGDRILD